MLFLLLATLASTSILITFKVFNKLNINTITAISFNYLTGATIGYLIISKEVSRQYITDSSWLFPAFLMGFILIAGFILFAISTKQAGIAITSISSRISVVFSVLLGVFLFNDSIGILKIAGFILTIIALFLIFYRKDNTGIGRKVFIVPILVFLLSGLNDSTLKIAEHYFIQDNEVDYICYAASSFLFAFLMCLPLLGYQYYAKGEVFNIRSISAGILLGLLNWSSIYFMLNGLKIMEVSVFFPILNIGVVALSTISGYIFFKERLGRINVIGIVVAILSIVMITVNF